jgi:hypothetical protein
MNHLITCKTCEKQLAALAETCPGCGAPNDWVHEDIQRFISAGATVPTARPFTYSNNKTHLSGQTAPRSPLWAWVVSALLFLASMLGFVLLGWVATFVLGGLCIVVLRLTQTTDYFQADLQARSWSSSNDRFWLPVRQLLKL